MAGYFESHWYKDKMDVYALTSTIIGNVKKQEFVKVYSNVKCKMYRTAQSALDITTSSGKVQEQNSIAYPTKYKISAGDKIILWQYGKNYGDESKGERYIAGKAKQYLEPFGGVRPGIEHNQITISLEERNTN